MTLWREDLIPINPYSRPGTPLRLVRNIVIHYTGNPGASAANHVSYFGKVLAEQNPNDDVDDTYASAHVFVDPIEAVLIIPLSEIAYHASQANPYSIGVELCIERDGTFHPDTVRRAAAIVAELCKQYELNPLRDVIRHYDVTGKICPKPYVDDPKAWEAFRQAVENKMKGVEDMDALTLTQEGWATLAGSLQKAYDGGLLGDYRYVEKAFKGGLTRSELDVANNLILVNGATR
jgi:N-acetylmuramoyl-L-alanine amidase CwlA